LSVTAECVPPAKDEIGSSPPKFDVLLGRVPPEEFSLCGNARYKAGQIVRTVAQRRWRNTRMQRPGALLHDQPRVPDPCCNRFQRSRSGNQAARQKESCAEPSPAALAQRS